MWTLQEVYDALDDGDRFYTEADGERAAVEKWDCDTCDTPTLRTDPDGSEANNRDNLPECAGGS